MAGLSRPATTEKEGIREDAPGAWALFQSSGSLGTFRKVPGTRPPISTQPPAVSASELQKLSKGSERRKSEEAPAPAGLLTLDLDSEGSRRGTEQAWEAEGWSLAPGRSA